MNTVLLKLNGMRATNLVSMCSGFSTLAYPATWDTDLSRLWIEFSAFDYSVGDKLTAIRDSEL